MMKKLLYFISVLSGIFIALYFLQSSKTGKGFNAANNYELVKNWLKLPEGFILGNPTGLGIFTNQNIVVFHRAERKWSLFGSMPDEPIKSKTM